MSKNILKALVFFSIVSMFFVGGNVLAAETWTTKTSMPTARSYSGVGVVDGKIYVIGGANSSSSKLAANEMYDPSTNSWTTKADMPTARMGLVVGVVNGKIYAIGGLDTSTGTHLAANEMYDPATNSWTTKADMPTARSYSVAAVVNNKIYVIGGHRSSGTTNYVEEYNPATNSWTTKATMNSEREAVSAGVVDDKIYVFGGVDSNTNPNYAVNLNGIYDPATNLWSSGVVMSTARAYTAAAALNGKIYVFGGWNYINGSKLSTNAEYDAVVNSWTTKADMPTARAYSVAAVVNNKIYVIGGYSGGYLSTNEEYDIGPVNGVCGSSSGGSYSSAPLANLCSVGESSSVTTNPTTYTWSCAGFNGGTTANCSANRIINGVCGSSNGGTFPTAPTTNLCSAGNTSSVSGSGPWSWSCNGVNGGTIANCSANITPTNGVCGTAQGHGYQSTSYIDTSSERCEPGTFTSFIDNGSSWGWNCNGFNGGTNASCSANKVATGSSSNKTFKNQPATNLCVYGTVAGQTFTNDIWYWFCTNNPGENAAGYAYKTTCGSSNGGSFSSPPETNLCKYGGASFVTTNPSTYTWTCTGDDSLAVSCSASRAIPTNGVCGTAQGHGYQSTSYIDTSSERCEPGTFTSFIDNGSSWGWNCTGLNGGTTASCSANKVAIGTSHDTTLKNQPATNLCVYGTATTLNLINNIWYWSCTNNPGVDAVGYTYKTTCGSSNGGSFSSAPTTNLCMYGTPSSVSGSGPWTWACTGNDSLAVSCSANIISSDCGTASGHGYISTSDIDTSSERCAAGTFSGSFIDNGSYWSWGCNGAPSWTSKANMSTARRDPDAAVVNGKIYAIGGSNGGSYVSSVEEYDPATNTWTTKASIPTVRQGFAKAIVIDNKIYVLGGSDGTYSLKTNEMYDPATNTWTVKANMPTTTLESCIVAVNDKIYVIDTYGTTRPSYEYNPATNTWTAKAAIPNQRQGEVGVAVANGKIYVIGGWLSDTYLGTTDEFDPATNTWTTKASMVHPRGITEGSRFDGGMVVVINNKIYAIGGNKDGTVQFWNEEFDPATNTWTTKANVPFSWMAYKPAVVNNKLYVMGGYTGYTTSAVYVYDPLTNTWTAKASMPHEKEQFEVAVLNNSIYTIGGYASLSTYPYTFYLNYNEVYDSSTPCSANKVAVDTSHDTTLKDPPSENLCAYGNASTPSLVDDIWYWTCSNNPGVDAVGYAYKTTCGSSNGESFSSPPETNLCKYGDASSVTTNPSTYTWTCTGDDSLPIDCSATKTEGPVDGSCGTAQGQLYSSVPSSLCSAGAEASFTTNATTYTWTCNGSGGGSNANCSSNRISFKNPYDINSDESCWFCEHYYDVSGILRNGKLSNGIASLEFRFTTNASDYNSYKLAIGTVNDVNQAMKTDDWLPVSSSETLFGGARVRRSGADQKEGSNGFLLTYGNGTSAKTYYWWVKLRKPSLTETEWMYGGTLATPEKAFPLVRVAADKTTVTLGTDIQYCTTLASLTNTADPCYPICWTGTGDPVVDPDNSNWKCSVCYNSSNQPVPCATANGNAFSWVLPEQSGSYMETTNASSTNPIFRFSSTVQNLKPGLAIMGSECAGEGETGTTAPLPKWREVSPF